MFKQFSDITIISEKTINSYYLLFSAFHKLNDRKKIIFKCSPNLNHNQNLTTILQSQIRLQHALTVNLL